MNKYYYLLSLLLVPLIFKGQVAMTIQVPPVGLTIKPQLWNLSVVHGKAAPMNVRVDMIMREATTNQVVLSGVSRVISVGKGGKQLTARDLGPIAYKFGNPGYDIDPNPDGFLPIGSFNICYSLFYINSDAPETLAEECAVVQVEPISPPQLVMPGDKEATTSKYPMFSWLAPAPLNMTNKLQYQWVITEVNKTQTPADAIQKNIPLLKKLELSQNYFYYPTGAPPLDTSKTYAWQVLAKTNGSPIALSEIWTFKLKEPEIQKSSPYQKSSYSYKMQKEEDGALAICTGLLEYEFYNENNNSVVNLNLVDLSVSKRKTVSIELPSQKIIYGQNFMQIDFRKNKDMIPNHLYLLVLTDSRNERWYLKFEFRKPA